MLSIIIATLDSERELVRTLAALVPGAMAGLVGEVVLADGGSRDDTAIVAEVAGCKFQRTEGSLTQRLKAAASSARGSWLMFLRPGTVPDASWVAEVARFMERPAPDGGAAVFRRGASGRPAWRAALSLLAAAHGRPRREQGLLISRCLYDAIGGHSENASDPEADLLRRIGRRRLVTLSSGVLADT